MDNHQLQQKQLFTRVQQKEQTTTYLNKPQKEQTLRGVEQQRSMGQQRGMEQPQEIHSTTKKGMLNDVSLVAIIASTLASITSFVLSSQIGLTGSLIGVGVAAAASALASQVCSSVLTATGEKIKAQQAKQEQQAQQAQSHGIDLNNNHYDKTPYRDTRYPTPLAPQHLRLAAARQAKRRLVLISVTSTLIALVCVGIYAAVVMFATHGEGIGSKQVLNSNSLSAALASKKPENTEKTAANTSKKNTAANGKNKDVSADQNTPDTNALNKDSQKQTTTAKTEQDETNQQSDEKHKGTEDKHKGDHKEKTRTNDNKSQGTQSNQQSDTQQKASKDAADN